MPGTVLSILHILTNLILDNNRVLVTTEKRIANGREVLRAVLQDDRPDLREQTIKKIIMITITTANTYLLSPLHAPDTVPNITSIVSQSSKQSWEMYTAYCYPLLYLRILSH